MKLYSDLFINIIIKSSICFNKANINMLSCYICFNNLFNKFNLTFNNHGHPTEAFLVAQIVKNLPAMQKTWVQSLGQEEPLEVSSRNTQKAKKHSVIIDIILAQPGLHVSLPSASYIVCRPQCIHENEEFKNQF